MVTKYSHPIKLNDSSFSLDYNEFAEELQSAQYSLGLLEGSHRKLHNPSLLISPLTAKEATVSSRIEGTQSSVSDVFLHEAGGISRHADIQQVANYRNAMRYAIEELRKGRQLTMSLIKTLHQMLLSDVRHKGTIGEFRDKPVWIAEKEGDSIEKAIYIPPENHFVFDYMENLLSYLHNGDISALIKAGITHYQFEAIHPFEDGNGRIGRLLIPLVLCYRKKLSEPILYLSGYFDSHRDEYLTSLHRVDQDGDYGAWLAFFFKSVSEQLKETQKLVDDIYGLYNSVREEVKGIKSPYIIPFIDFLFKSPIFSIPMIKASIKTSSLITVQRLIKLFKLNNLVSEMPHRQGRFKLFRFNPLLQKLQ
jgi:Fic family protein